MSLLLSLALSIGAPAPLERHRHAPPADDESTTVISGRDFVLPLRVRDDAKANLRELQLHVSVDGGRTWHLADAVSPDEASFRFCAPRDGLYLFKLRLVWKNGTVEPKDLTRGPPDQKVRVRSDR
jgi:hypothetical protein